MELISKEVVKRIIDSGRTKEQMLEMVESAVTFEECEDCISRSEAIRIASGYCHWSRIPEELAKLPSVKPKFTDEEIQTMQDLEQAQIQKAYEIGKAEDVLEQDKPQESEEDEIIFNNLCNSCSNIGCVFQSGIVRTKCAFYMPPHIEPDNCGNYIVIHQQS